LLDRVYWHYSISSTEGAAVGRTRLRGWAAGVVIGRSMGFGEVYPIAFGGSRVRHCDPELEGIQSQRCPVDSRSLMAASGISTVA
jgi:hypothetical protein